MEEEIEKDKIGSVMVVGGGIGGMQASLDLADSGFYVYLVENKSAIGGVMAQLDKTFPTNDCSMCIMGPKLVECGRHLKPVVSVRRHALLAYHHSLIKGCATEKLLISFTPKPCLVPLQLKREARLHVRPPALPM
jgi:phytoene dehydrogenase-like protein